MCGIIGYTGVGDGVKKVMRGLSVLEYRGYDSAGVAAVCEGETRIVKTEGRVQKLAEKIGDRIFASTAIGHTRWATHGTPSDTNAHPHRVGAVTIVHNGIIENYGELAKEVKERGISPVSSTDTEIAAAYIDICYKRTGEPLSAIREALSHFIGNYAFAMLFDGHGDKIYAVRSGSPLVLGEGDDGYYLASDITALLPFTQKYYILAEGELAVLDKNSASIISESGAKKIENWSLSTLTESAAERGEYEHYMYKEMLEEPEKIIGTATPRIFDGLPRLSVDGISETVYRDIGAIQIVACGSAMYAGLVGARLIEELAVLPATVHVASEYRYYPPVGRRNTLVVLISQSGETADTLAALRAARKRGYKTLAIVNATDSTIAREADCRMYTYAGPEIAVATTKGYATQLSALWLLAVSIGHSRGRLDTETARKTVGALITDAPSAMRKVFEDKKRIKEISHKICGRNSVFYIGRGLDHHLAREGALKLKEISYIHAEAYAAGELKHGTIALIEEGTPVIAIATDTDVYGKLESNIREVKARGASVILIAPTDACRVIASADEYIDIYGTTAPGRIFGTVAAIQMLAYEVAKARGCDIDHPKNLAKSVTVE